MRTFLFISWAAFATAQTLPQTWAGAGVAYAPAGSPKVAGWASLATLVSKPAQAYSFTTIDFIPVGGKVSLTQTSIRTGVATPLKTFGPVTVLGLAEAGIATAGSSTTGAYSGGGIGVWKIGTSNWTVEVGARLVKTGTATSVVWEIGPGRIWP